MQIAIIEIIRSSIRPILTVIFAAVFAQAVTEGIALPEWFIAAGLGYIGWWFGDRTIQHIKETK